MPADYPEGGGFAELLDWHLKFGTRPGGAPGQPGKRWRNKEFATAVGVGSDEIVRNWRTARVTRVKDFGAIEAALFGTNEAFECWRAELRAAHATANRTARLPTVIPGPPYHFLGRDSDVAAILGVLREGLPGQAILVQGGPGIGKTSLTRAVGNHSAVVELFGEEYRWFAECDTATTAVALQDAVAHAIGADPARGFKATCAALRARPGLLVLDGLEVPWDPKDERAKTETTLAELAAVPDLTILASFRGFGRVEGLPWALVHRVEGLAASEDAELFRRFAQRDYSTDAHFDDFLRALGGIPLAIELVAWNALGRSSLAALWTDWTRIGTELAAHPDFDADHLNALPHAIELSLGSSRMTDPARRLFALLGQLPAGIAAEDRDALIGADGFAAGETLLRLGLAIERRGRLDLLPPVREHALRHHTPGPDDQAAWPTHYLDLTRRLGEAIGFRHGDGAMARLHPEFADIEAAFRASLAAGRRADAMAALTGLRRLAHAGSLPTPVLAELERSCRADGDVHGEAWCKLSRADVALSRNDGKSARLLYDTALPVFSSLGDLLGEAICLARLGGIALQRIDLDGAHAAFEKALPLFRAVGFPLGEANCVKGFGYIALVVGSREKARAAYERALQLYREAGNVDAELECRDDLERLKAGT